MQSTDISHLPTTPGVYIFKDKKGTVLYIGKAKNLKRRVAQYFSPGSVRKQEMVAQAETVEFVSVRTESESLYLESNLIKKHQPPFNNMLKGANAYAYIKLTNHPIPQIFITRKKTKDGATYIGPKHHTRELKKFLQYLRQIVQYRTCPLSQFNQGKRCSDAYFGLCGGRCEKKGAEKPEYPKLITDFFKGNTKPIESKIKQLIDQAVQTENFERAAKLRDIYFQIDQFTEKQSVEFAKSFSGYLLQIREIGTRRVYVLLHFYEGKMIDIIRHHFQKDEMDEETMLASFSSEFGDFEKKEERYSTNNFPWTKEDKSQMIQLFNNFFESYLVGKTIQGNSIMTDLLKTLQDRYHLSQFPYHIECLDISHLGGSRTSGGLSALIGGLPDKHHYRKYKIQGAKNDDYLSLTEVLTRRFKLNEKNISKEENASVFPNVFILDGGKGQLSILENLIKEYPNMKNILNDVQFCALGKGEARHKTNIGKKSKKNENLVGEKLYVRRNGIIQEYDFIYDEADKLLIKLRDEAHRFANYYRKQQEHIAFKLESEKINKRKNK